ncbi:MAG: response regulator [Pseudomonadota bacterium]
MSDTLKKQKVDSETPLILNVEYTSKAGFLKDYDTNISRGGTMVCTNRGFTDGQAVDLLISFPGLLKPIAVEGVVQWARQEDVNEYVIGVQFRRWVEETRSGLADMVRRIREGDKTLITPYTMRILVAEDNELVATMIRRGLEAYQRREGTDVAFETSHAEDGQAALRFLEQQDCDLLIVDIFMPVLDGIQLIRKLRALSRWRSLPIIAVSAGGSEMGPSVLDAGADFFLDKPLRLNDVLKTMRQLMISAPRVADEN